MNPFTSAGASIFCATLNHLLRNEDWARARLARHAGARIRIEVPAPFPPMELRVGESGVLQPGTSEGEAQLRITLHARGLPLLAARKQEALQYIELSGNADLAAAAQEIFLKLEWDVEEDLSRVFGDIAAHRMANAGRDFLAWQRDAFERASRNVAEFLVEERQILPHRSQMADFTRSIESLRDDTERLRARVDAIERLGRDRST